MFKFEPGFGVFEKKLDIPSNSFDWLSIYHKEDERQEQWEAELKLYGFSEKELWNLYASIALFIYPRLVAFRKMNKSKPSHLSDTEWDKILDEMIFAFQYVLETDEKPNQKLEEKAEDYKKATRGLILFAKNFFDLWS